MNIRHWLRRLFRRPRPSYRESILKTPGLVGYWPLDEMTGSVAEDISGNENHGIFK